MLHLREDTIARSRPLGISGQLRDRSQSTHSSFEGDEIQISNADKFYFVFSPLSSSAVTTEARTPRRGDTEGYGRARVGWDGRTDYDDEGPGADETGSREPACRLGPWERNKKFPAVRSLLNSPLKNRVKPKREKYASPNSIMLEKEMVENCA